MGRYKVPVGRYVSDVRCANCGEMLGKTTISLIHCMCLSKGLTQAYIHQILKYDADRGLFEWRLSIGRGRSGEIAGRINGNGYIRIAIRKRDYLVHRLAWFYVFGRMPESEIDHINGDQSDNRFCNLREATRLENQQNLSPNSRNTTGFPGVRKKRKRWQSRICLEGTQYHLGTFDTPEEAAAAHRQAKERLHAFNPIQRGAPDLGPGDHGVSHCEHHGGMTA